jgi:predicted nucleic acid-binding protein
MTYALDANILLRLANPAAPLHPTAANALLEISKRGDDCAIFPQALYEFWAVPTRPVAANGLSFLPATAARWVTGFHAQFQLLHDSHLTFDQWERLMTTYSAVGRVAHDARYVAAMKVHGLTHLLTFNVSDFVRYVAGEGITVVDPATV